MSKSLKSFNFDGSLSSSDILLDIPENVLNEKLVHGCVVAIMNNNRQWSASTKTRADVNHSGQKPHAQKGTGRARQGFLGSPQYKGGGVVFGPAPKFGVRNNFNKKQRRIAAKSVLIDKISSDRALVLNGIDMDKPSTASVSAFFKSCSISGKVLFIMDSDVSAKCENFKKSIRNIKTASFSLLKDVNAHTLIAADWVVFCDAAYKNIVSYLGGN